MVEEFKAARGRTERLYEDQSQTRLKSILLEMQNRIVVFTDASYNEENENSAYGVVIVNGKGCLHDFRARQLGKAGLPFGKH